jgi:hypothetical protein
MKKRIILLVALCALLGLACTACVASRPTGATGADIAKVEAERDKLKDELERVKSENETLTAQVASFQAKIEAVEKEGEMQEGDVAVILTNKTSTEGDYGQIYANFEFSVTNNTAKAIKGIQGTASFNDIFDVTIIKLGGDFTGATINPGETRIFDDLSLDCNRFMDDHLKLYNTKYEDLKLVYEVTAIVFEDGTTKK